MEIKEMAKRILKIAELDHAYPPIAFSNEVAQAYLDQLVIVEAARRVDLQYWHPYRQSGTTDRTNDSLANLHEALITKAQEEEDDDEI